MAEARTRAATAGVVGLALVAAGLAYVAMKHDATTTSTTVVSPGTSSASPSSGTATSTSSAPPSSGTATSTNLAVSAVSRTVAWRATAGSCTTGTTAHVEVTTDGGQTWRSTGSPAAQVVTLAAAGPQRAVEIGYDGSCTLRKRTTADGGRTWSSPVDVAGVWTHDASAVIPPTGPAVSACGGSLVVATDGADPTIGYALCGDGKVVRSVDAGVTFLPRSTVPGAVALGGSGPGEMPDGTIAVELVAVRDAPGCDGTLVLSSPDSGSSWGTGTCVTAATSASVGLDASDSTVWLVSGSKVFRSTDGGTSFAAVP